MMQTRQVAICLCVYRHASDFLDSTPRGTARNLDELFDKVRPQRSIEVLNLKQRHGGQKEFARPFEWILPYLTYHYGAAIYKANYTQVYSIASISHAAASCQMIKLFFLHSKTAWAQLVPSKQRHPAKRCCADGLHSRCSRQTSSLVETVDQSLRLHQNVTMTRGYQGYIGIMHIYRILPNSKTLIGMVLLYPKMSQIPPISPCYWL